MKKKLVVFSISLLLIAGSFLTQSCEKVKKATEFDVDKSLPSHHFDLDSAKTSSAKGEVLLYSAYYDINLDSILEANGIDKGLISEGKFKEIILSIEKPSDEMNFNFVSTLSFRLGENEHPEEAEIIASASNIAKGETKITFKVNDRNMDKYLELSKFYFNVYGTIIGEVPIEKLPLVIDSKVRFKVSPLN